MNIIVRTYSGKICFRPDTSWKERDDAAYLPEFVNSVSASPALFVRICKAGRFVSSKFARRYYDSFAYGMFLYPDDLLNDGPEGFACASCLDHSTFVSYPLRDVGALAERGLRVCRDGEEFFACPPPPESVIDSCLEFASSRCYLRTGDFLAIELGPIRPLCARDEAECQVCAYCGDNLIFDFKTVF